MRKVSEIAQEISQDWKNINYGAKPYLDAMHTMTNVTDKYIADSGPSVIRYFLANASTWRGENAKRIKKELNDMIKGVY